MRIAISASILFLIWLALSGHYTVLVTSLGVASAILSAYIAERMGVLDSEGMLTRIMFRLPRVSLWLIWEILKSNIGVIKIIIDPNAAIPQLVTVKASQKTAVGLVTHANFITLTPGTVTVNVDEARAEFVVHAITDEFAAGCTDGVMDQKVSGLEGAK